MNLIRNYKGIMVVFEEKEYSNEQEKYEALWKIKYNVSLKKNDSKKQILKYLKNQNQCNLER